MNLKIERILKYPLPALHFGNKNWSVEDKLRAVPERIYVIRNTGKMRIRNRKRIIGRTSGSQRIRIVK